MRAIGVVMVLAASAHADVNLLAAVPTTVAVSSTVDNAAILPSHLVDGKLDTAWNSRTDELVGAWIAVRVPKGAHVTGFKLTAGFVHVQGNQDWFLWNARITKLRITHAGKSIDAALDPNNRGLQAIPFSGDDGDYKLEVAEIIPGARATWREIAISEFEVWGNVDGKARTDLKPTVVVGSLDAAPVSEAQCVKAMFPDATKSTLASGDRVTATSVLVLSTAYVVCRVDHTDDVPQGSDQMHSAIETVSEIALVATTGKLVGAPIRETRTNGTKTDAYQNSWENHEDTVETTPLAVSPTESVLVVANTDVSHGIGDSGYQTKTTLYRATATGLVAIYTFTSQDSTGEEERGNVCDLAIARQRAPFADLALDCTEIATDWHHLDPDHNSDRRAPHHTTLHWTGKAYAP
ncbi:MAG TPA: hypothetical protein VGG28_32025 [Kofleriaceae bacterium]|jgi:hypothetical protein